MSVCMYVEKGKRIDKFRLGRIFLYFLSSFAGASLIVCVDGFRALFLLSNWRQLENDFSV